jgi:predicted 3-demethylubiquinone-9 3-methyltransferase (glyoxalase superfamily)
MLWAASLAARSHLRRDTLSAGRTSQSAGDNSMQTIKSFLWFDNNAEEAVQYYLSVFPDGKLHTRLQQPEGGPLPAGSVITIEFSLHGMDFIALNGGPEHKFNEAVSFVLPCESQAEIDEFWSKFIDGGGKEIACGWLRDKFGLCWQVVPHNIGELLRGRDAEGGKRAFQAMMQMKKLDIAELQRAGGLA